MGLNWPDAGRGWMTDADIDGTRKVQRCAHDLAFAIVRWM